MISRYEGNVSDETILSCRNTQLFIAGFLLSERFPQIAVS